MLVPSELPGLMSRTRAGLLFFGLADQTCILSHDAHQISANQMSEGGLSFHCIGDRPILLLVSYQDAGPAHEEDVKGSLNAILLVEVKSPCEGDSLMQHDGRIQVEVLQICRK